MKRKFYRAGLAATAMALVLGASSGALFAEETETDVAIDEANFPDSTFRSYVKSVIDKNQDGVLQSSEGDAVFTIELQEKHLKTVEGIKFFPNLTTLNVTANDIMSLDLSQNPKLEMVFCMSNKLSILDVSKCPELRTLVCSENAINKLDLTQNPKLHDVACNNNDIKELDLSKNPDLAEIDCSSNRIKTLDISNNPQMTLLLCAENKLADLDLSHAPELTTLYASMNPLGSLDLSKNPKLETVVVEACELSALDVSKNENLDILACTANQITELDLKNNKNLTALRCEENKLSSMDLSANSKLDLLFVSNNELKTLDVSALTELQALDCKSNQLTSLDLSKNENLMELVCSENKLAGLDLSAAKGLVLLECEHNDFKELNISFNPNMIFLYFNVEPEKTKDVLVYYFESETVSYEFVVSADVVMITDDQPGDPGEDPDDPTGPSVADFVERLYTIALGRESEQEGKEYWVNEIESGNRTGGDCARFFLIEAPEFLNRGLNEEDFVETLYLTFFDRPSEAAGKKFWVDGLKSGKLKKENVIMGFIDSTEWCNVCATYGVKSGAPNAKAEFASLNAIKFATRLYTCCLGRDPEEGGLNYWSLALTNLEQTGCSAAKNFFTSAEFIGFKLKDDEYVTRLYTTFMGRDPEESEVAYWVGEIAKGTQTKESVMAFFGSSEEFTNICKQYGIDRGTI